MGWVSGELERASEIALDLWELVQCPFTLEDDESVGVRGVGEGQYGLFVAQQADLAL